MFINNTKYSKNNNNIFTNNFIQLAKSMFLIKFQWNTNMDMSRSTQMFVFTDSFI